MTDQEKLAKLLGEEGHEKRTCVNCDGSGHIGYRGEPEFSGCDSCDGTGKWIYPKPPAELIELAEKRLGHMGFAFSLHWGKSVDASIRMWHCKWMDDLGSKPLSGMAYCKTEQQARLQCAIKVLERLKEKPMKSTRRAGDKYWSPLPGMKAVINFGRNTMNRIATARATDPDTSHLAGEEMERSGKAQTQREIVLEAVGYFVPLTSAEIAKCSELDRFQVARRLPELEYAGLVRRLPKRQCNVCRSQSVTWERIMV